MNPSSSGFATRAVHAGERMPRPDFTPMATPIHHSVAYAYEHVDDLDAIFEGTRDGFVYGRYGNPTVKAFETAVADLEGAESAVAFASGMAAIHAALLGAGARAGATVVSAADVYGATYALQETLLAELGVRSRFVDVADLPAVAALLRETRPVALVCEVVSNPLLKVADLGALAETAHQVGAALVVDATFASPYLCRPLEWGADYVVHSATKYLAGHGDVMAGVVACSAERARDLSLRQRLIGANLAPEEAWLALRGLKTLPLRLGRQCANAEQVAAFLAGHPAVARVNFPGLAAHPQHDLCGRLYGGRGYGAMISFDLRDAGRRRVFDFMDALQLVAPATTLGDIYSLVLYPAGSSHRAVDPEIRGTLGIGDGLVRLSVGIEDAADIIADLDQALNAVSA